MSKKKKKYPQKKTRKNTKTKKQSFITWFLSSLLKLVITMILVGAFIGVLVIGYLFITTEDVTEQNFWSSKNTTQIKDRDDELIQIHGKNMKYVELDEISEEYIDGLITTEDANFYKHTGVDFKGMIRAVIQTIFTKSDSGGSTITMQLAKNLYLLPVQKINKEGELEFDDNGEPIYEYPYHNKIDYKLKQIVYAWKIEAKYTKDEILVNYVNSLGFDGPVGIEKASMYYFGVNAKNLDLSQAALLAGMTQLPNKLNPNSHIEASKARRDVVLYNMKENKKITKEEYEKAKDEKIEETLLEHDENSVDDEEYEIIKPFLDEVTVELQSLFGSDFNINTADATIYTTLDYGLQEEVYHIINNDYGNVGYESDVLQAGSTTLDVSTGEILTIGGGRRNIDISSTQNYGSMYLRQPGSTSKPLVDYGPALEYLGWSTNHQMVDTPITYTGGPTVQNAYDGYYGQMSIQEALSRSTNTIALQTFKDVVQGAGMNKISEFMENLGLEDVDGLNEAYSIGGWNAGTTPLELAGAYAAFGNGGVYNEPHAIKKIVFEPTSPYYEEYGSEFIPEFDSKKAMSASTAYMITKMLDPNLSTALTSSMYVSGLGEQGIKTGTSNWGENNYGIPEGAPRDKWVAGYNGNVSTVIWTGFSGEYERQGYYFDSYGMWSYDIYRNIMESIANSEKEYLQGGSIVAASDVYSVDLQGSTYYFRKGTEEYKNELAREKKVKEEQKKIEEEKQKEEEEEKKKEDASGDNGISSWNQVPGNNSVDNNGDNSNNGDDSDDGDDSDNNGNNSNNGWGGSDGGNTSVPFT